MNGRKLITRFVIIVKVRMQSAKKSATGVKLGTIGTAKDVIKNDTFFGLYRGVSAEVTTEGDCND